MCASNINRIDQMGSANRWGKRLAPLMAAPLQISPVARGVRLLENYLAILQGKGAGSGWGLLGEAEAAARQIRTAQPLIVDVGANLGHWSLALDALLASLHPCYLLIEPSPHCQAALQRLPLRCFEVVQAAAGDHDGEAELLSERAASEAASLHERRDSFHQSDRPPARDAVAVRRLDSLTAEREVEFINLLKLDVEGSELEALRGAERLLNEGRIGAIAFEFGSAHINSRVFFHDLWDLLTPLGFAMQRIVPGGGLLPVRAYYEDLEFYRGVSNYLALPDPARLVSAAPSER
ncbi:MAG: FkbM family methyltransferase [Caldilineaceae bacterium]